MFQKCSMSGRKRKLEQIVSDLKTESGKKQKADGSLLSGKSNMASNKENLDDSVSESESELDLNTDSNTDTGGEKCLRFFMQNISKDINKSINGLNRRMNQMETTFERQCPVIVPALYFHHLPPYPPTLQISQTYRYEILNTE